MNNLTILRRLIARFQLASYNHDIEIKYKLECIEATLLSEIIHFSRPAVCMVKPMSDFDFATDKYYEAI